MQIKTVLLGEERTRTRAFLKRYGLVYEDDIDTTLIALEGESIIATASAAGNIIKCVAVDAKYQGQNILNTLMSQLIKTLHENNQTHLFVYTQPEHIDIFRSLGFKKIVETMNMAFMERSGDIEETLKRLKKKHGLSGEQKGSVVINANPLTKGHVHLIHEAAKYHETLCVFVVSEDRSFFPFEDRFNIIKETFKNQSNIHVLPTKNYLVSYATFPKYFLSKEETIKKEHALIDVLTFKQHYMKIFNITARYVGDEPYSPMTNVYNETMAHYLGDALVVIPRKEIDHAPISASTVRKLLKRNGVSSIKRYVPDATYKYLLSEKGQKTIRTLKDHHGRH